jgi:hypothetical protein
VCRQSTHNNSTTTEGAADNNLLAPFFLAETDMENSNTDKNISCPNCGHELAGTEKIRMMAAIAADAATTHIRDEFYKKVGENIISRILWMVAALIAALAAWLTTHDIV